MDGKCILIADSDVELRSALAKRWSAEGLGDVVEFGTYADAFECAKRRLYEFMVLELSLSDGNGVELCRALRESNVTCPILIISKSHADEDLISSLNAGANDYVTKPFSYAVLKARIEARLRSHRSNENAVYRIGPYIFRPSDKTLMEGSRRIRLTEKESNVLKHLLRSGRTVGRKDLLQEVWGYSATVSTHTLETHIYRLRQKIEKDLSKWQLVLTEGEGYRLNA